MPKQMDEAAGPDGPSAASGPDAHGEAALLLVESLIHGLVARSGLSIAEAVDVVEIATDTQIEISDARGDAENARPSVKYLLAIRDSLQADIAPDGHATDDRTGPANVESA